MTALLLWGAYCGCFRKKYKEYQRRNRATKCSGKKQRCLVVIGIYYAASNIIHSALTSQDPFIE